MRFALLFVALVLAGCTADGRAGNPVSRIATWFSYLNGDDLRARCDPGAVPRYRFVYNAVYLEQVRIYDLAPADNGAFLLDSKVTAGRLPATLEIDENGIRFPGLAGETRRLIGGGDVAQLFQALADDGFGRPTPRGRVLHSDSYYWLAMGCHGGRFVYQAWSWPEDRLGSLRFADRLLAHDDTGVKAKAPRDSDFLTPGSRPRGGGRANEDNGPYFSLQVGDNGLNIGPRF
ncbi:hypothetical protein [Oceanibacterium hippocampi]|uniref:Lipoprotein n=1 Tax=Oceanibacterium hippocampi TaxID=745714 RepID=A0A1Y5SLV1_9PROT|nr:hypothetical protein [Oceanibacterium hippocampi]SLN43583.1 hypothetical protein OCH7691_01817 [Oceanibacterium hippocampi]